MQHAGDDLAGNEAVVVVELSLHGGAHAALGPVRQRHEGRSGRAGEDAPDRPRHTRAAHGLTLYLPPDVPRPGPCADGRPRRRYPGPRPVGDEQHGLSRVVARTSASRASAVSRSRWAVGSSRIRIGASARNVRASAMRRRSPPDTRSPSSPTNVSSPAGSDSTQSRIRARRRASGSRRRTHRVAPSERSRGSSSRTYRTPGRRARPRSGRPLTERAHVGAAEVGMAEVRIHEPHQELGDRALPAPDGPTSATRRPGGRRRSTPRRPHPSPSPWSNDACSRPTEVPAGSGSGWSGSATGADWSANTGQLAGRTPASRRGSSRGREWRDRFE